MQSLLEHVATYKRRGRLHWRRQDRRRELLGRGKSDVLIPAALEGQITAERAHRMQDPPGAGRRQRPDHSRRRGRAGRPRHRRRARRDRQRRRRDGVVLRVGAGLLVLLLDRGRDQRAPGQDHDRRLQAHLGRPASTTRSRCAPPPSRWPARGCCRRARSAVCTPDHRPARSMPGPKLTPQSPPCAGFFAAAVSPSSTAPVLSSTRSVTGHGRRDALRDGAVVLEAVQHALQVRQAPPPAGPVAGPPRVPSTRMRLRSLRPTVAFTSVRSGDGVVLVLLAGEPGRTRSGSCPPPPRADPRGQGPVPVPSGAGSSASSTAMSGCKAVFELVALTLGQGDAGVVHGGPWKTVAGSPSIGLAPHGPAPRAPRAPA